MGEIARRLKKLDEQGAKKERKPRAGSKKAKKKDEILARYTQHKGEDITPERLALREKARAMVNYFACVTYEVAQRSCHWCQNLEHFQSDLTFPSPYGRHKFCSEECMKEWHIWSGVKLPKKFYIDHDEEDFIPETSEQSEHDSLA